MSRRQWWSLAAGAALVAAVGASEQGLGRSVAAQAKPAVSYPVFEVDPAWPPKLPYNWIVGHVPSVAVDSRGHVFLLSRPEHAAARGPRALGAAGRGTGRERQVRERLGRPGIPGFDWPDSEHGIAIDYKDNVWIGGSAPVAPSLRTTERRHAAQVHARGEVPLADRRTRQECDVAEPAGSRRQQGHQERAPGRGRVRVSEDERGLRGDGYGNRRVIVFDADTGAFKRLWGAFGNEPIDVLPAAATGSGS